MMATISMLHPMLAKRCLSAPLFLKCQSRCVGARAGLRLAAQQLPKRRGHDHNGRCEARSR